MTFSASLRTPECSDWRLQRAESENTQILKKFLGDAKEEMKETVLLQESETAASFGSQYHVNGNLVALPFQNLALLLHKTNFKNISGLFYHTWENVSHIENLSYLR